jgi:hypothetical protein
MIALNEYGGAEKRLEADKIRAVLLMAPQMHDGTPNATWAADSLNMSREEFLELARKHGLWPFKE